MKKFKQVMVQWGAPALALALPMFAMAQITQPPISAPSNINNINQIAGSAGIVCTVINWIFWLLIVFTVIFVDRKSVV